MSAGGGGGVYSPVHSLPGPGARGGQQDPKAWGSGLNQREENLPQSKVRL